MPNFDPLLKDKLLGIPFAGAGTTLEKTALQTLIKSLIEENKYSVEYIINLCVSYGYSRKMASDVFTQLTGLSPKLIVENNEYYQNPVFVPSGTIAWGFAKGKKDLAYYVVPFEYGYVVNKKDEKEIVEQVGEFLDISSAIAKMKGLVSRVFTIDQIITESLLEDEPLQLNAISPLDTEEPFFSDPVRNLKNRYKKRFITNNEVKNEAFKLVAAEIISEKEGSDLAKWVDLEQQKREVEEDEDELAEEVVEFGTIKKDPKGIGQAEAQEKNVVKADEIIKHVDVNKDLKGFLENEIENGLGNYRPTGGTYIKLLDEVTKGNKITREEAREKYGLYNQKQWYNLLFKNASLKRKATEEFDLEILKKAEEKSDIEKAEESIDEMDIDSLLNEETPETYLQDEVKNDKVMQLSERVSNIVKAFTDKFEDFETYNIDLVSYKIQMLGEDEIDTSKVIEDVELNANALVMIIISISPKENMNNTKKALAIFSVGKEKTYWPGTIKADNGKIYAFTDNGLDVLFRELDTKEEIVEDII